MKRLFGILKAAFSPAWVNDTLAIVGLGLLAWGFGWMYLPLAPATVGAGLVLAAIGGARRKRKKPEE